MKAEALSKEDALKIVTQHLAERTGAGLQVLEEMPTGMYLRDESEPFWCIAVADTRLSVGSGRVICVSKSTGEILFDGYVGE